MLCCRAARRPCKIYKTAAVVQDFVSIYCCCLRRYVPGAAAVESIREENIEFFRSFNIHAFQKERLKKDCAGLGVAEKISGGKIHFFLPLVLSSGGKSKKIKVARNEGTLDIIRPTPPAFFCPWPPSVFFLSFV